MHILIADDDPIGLAISRHLASGAGHTVEITTDGGAALAAITTGRFDAALLDLHMPVLDGAAVARAVCAALPPGRRPRLIALSAATNPGGAGAIAALGFDAYLAKPLRLAALSAALAGDAPPPPLHPPPAAPPRTTPHLIRELLTAHGAGDAAALATLATALKLTASASSPTLAALAARLEVALAATDHVAIDYLVRAIGEQ